MADFNSSLPVKTQNPGDVVVKVGDGTTPANQLAIDSSGRVVSKLADGSGNSVTSQTSGAQRALDVGINVSGVQVDPRATRALTSADIVTAVQGTAASLSGAWPVKLTDGTNSGVLTAASTAAAATATALVVALSPNSPVPAGTNVIGAVTQSGTWTVASNGDGSASGGTAASKSLLSGGIYLSTAPTLTTGQQASLQLDASGNLKVAMGSAFKLADGSGNSITSQASGSQRALDVGINVAGVQVDPRAVRALTASDVVSANIKDSTGNAITLSNPLPVYLQETVGSAINSYLTSSAVAAGSAVNHDYTVTSGKTLTLQSVHGAASGKMKIEMQIETAAASGTFNSVFVGFNSTAEPCIDWLLVAPITVAAGVRVRVIRTNLDANAQDLYTTTSGHEN